ncbi:MAG: manganese efflux pump MntP family protein [Clostridiales Family XIII bacterium]|jgi:putative Mn2+ efflux pump MntP|nr:manganese efflux pump MntP family protein [Clostridiales Family XIII bacterium]
MMGKAMPLGLLEILLIGAGLSADALSVSVGNGLSMPQVRMRPALVIAATFGLFQALMPFIGCLLGGIFAEHIRAFDHIIALVLLAFIGGKMLLEGMRSLRARAGEGEESPPQERRLGLGRLLLQAVATSIDALVVGVSFAAVGFTLNGLVAAVLIIGATTFLFCIVGVYAGKRIGALLGKRAEVIGGLILIGIGLKIFIEHSFFSG